MKKLIFAVSALLFSLNSIAQKEDFSFYDGENYQLAEFRFWNPNLNDDYNGILVLTPGFNGDGREAVLDTVWQNLQLYITSLLWQVILKIIKILTGGLLTEMLQKVVETFYSNQ